MAAGILAAKALLLLGLVAGAQSQQCSSITILNESGGSYRARFSATASTSFTGLNLELRFDNAVNRLEFDSGASEKMDDHRFRLLSPGWVAQPGWKVEFTITPHYSGGKSTVVGAVMNGVDVCGNK
ncbi:uncharacterized protein LOC135209227 [Macrobrachium nipponense]|uniref:uncharacterized protein LOC135209227 n=1 Tax=Macrobrachium nipponense TaxID=159736 RepID=UPI0030C8186A